MLKNASPTEEDDEEETIRDLEGLFLNYILRPSEMQPWLIELMQLLFTKHLLYVPEKRRHV